MEIYVLGKVWEMCLQIVRGFVQDEVIKPFAMSVVDRAGSKWALIAMWEISV